MARRDGVGAEELAGGVLPFEEVVAVRDEVAGVQGGLRAVERGADLADEEMVAEGMGGAVVVVVAAAPAIPPYQNARRVIAISHSRQDAVHAHHGTGSRDQF